ncbi:MAG: ribose-phosphate diphosphokinase [Alphaproteobacteria bacterium]
MTLLFSFPDQFELQKSLLQNSNFAKGEWEWRHFPDGESYVRLLSDVKGRSAIILCSLNRPDEKILPLAFLASTLKELGAKKITLIAPYLGYLRQDKRFKPGEAITSSHFANLLTHYIDALVTIDPHLHRIQKLQDIYNCECTRLSAASLMAKVIVHTIKAPLLIGPDQESEQWVKDISEQANAPYLILSKIRHGDRDVEITLPHIEGYKNHTPVLIDDIISSAATMIKAVDLLKKQGIQEVVCIATHAVFATNAYEALINRNGVKVITTNAIPHISNGIDIAPLFTALNL